MKSITVLVRAWSGGEAREFEVRGQVARTLLALVDAGERGCSALELSSWALRLAAYTFELRTRHGLAIRTQREEHDGGWHGRHVLETEVEILLIEAGAESEVLT